ncbi:MAG: adenine deaminase C-terminal domain-containing protein [Thermodesulfobacteriota bacterium]
MSFSNLKSSKIQALIQVARGQKKATTVIKDILLVNVYSHEIQKNLSVGLFQDRIAYIGPDPQDLIGPQTQIISGLGQYLLPGFIDGHTHLDSIFTCRSYAPYALATGNTSAITEMAMIGNVFGRKGIDLFMQEAMGLPFKIFFLAPALTPPYPELETSMGMTPKEFSGLLKKPEVLGIGEAYWPRVLGLDPRVMAGYPLAHHLNKTREGHAAGARDKNLVAYVAAGATSCHESTNPDEAIERLRLGMAVMVREGFVRSELKAVAPIARMGLDLRRLMLVSDVFHPAQLLQKKGMNDLLAQAVSFGFDPITAVQTVTRNVADYFGLKDLGGIAPGKSADLVLVDNLTDFNCLKVWTNGELIWDQGKGVKDVPPFTYPLETGESFSISRVTPDLFCISSSTSRASVRTVMAVNHTITREGQAQLESKKGALQTDPDQDVLKVAVFQRREAGLRPSLGFCQGIGLKKGALATSLNWDTNNILVIGVTDQEMALAVNRLLELKGGIVVCREDRILAEMPMPVMGLISEEPLPVLTRQIEEIDRAIQSLGSALESPFLALQTFCFTGLPFIRLTDKGLADIRKKELVEMFLEND